MSDWKPIESAPMDGTSLIIATSMDLVGEASYCGSDGWWWANSHGEYWADAVEVHHGQVTHWMPLPAPPTGDERGEHTPKAEE